MSRVPLFNTSPPDGWDVPCPDMTRLDNGMYKDYWVLSAEERRRNLVQPVRREYRHMECFHVTQVHPAIAETLAACPTFYHKLYCVTCQDHFPAGDFVWVGTTQKVGT